MASYDITALSTALEYDTSNGNNPVVLQWSSTRVILFWDGGASAYGTVQAFDINAGTGAVTAVGSSLLVNGNANASYKKLIAFDSTHFVATWGNGTAYAKVFAVDGSGNITAAGALFTYSSITADPNIALLDATHFVAMGEGAGQDGHSVVCVVNTGTWAITEAGTQLEFDITEGYGRNGGNRILKVDGSHCLITHLDTVNEVIKALILTINTSDWTITAETALTSNGNPCQRPGLIPLDGSNHFLLTYATQAGVVTAQVLEVNLTTWAVTNVGTALAVISGVASDGIWAAKLDATHAVIFWEGSAKGRMRTLAIDGSWVVTAAGAQADIVASGIVNPSIALLSGYRFVGAWTLAADSDGFIQAVDVTPPTSISSSISSSPSSSISSSVSSSISSSISSSPSSSISSSVSSSISPSTSISNSPSSSISTSPSSSISSSPSTSPSSSVSTSPSSSVSPSTSPSSSVSSSISSSPSTSISSSISSSVSPSTSISSSPSSSISTSPSTSPSSSISTSPSSSISTSPSSSISSSISSSPSTSISSSPSTSISTSPSSSRSTSISSSISASPSPSAPYGIILGRNNDTGILVGTRLLRK